MSTIAGYLLRHTDLSVRFQSSSSVWRWNMWKIILKTKTQKTAFLKLINFFSVLNIIYKTKILVPSLKFFEITLSKIQNSIIFLHETKILTIIQLPFILYASTFIVVHCVVKKNREFHSNVLVVISDFLPCRITILYSS